MSRENYLKNLLYHHIGEVRILNILQPKIFMFLCFLIQFYLCDSRFVFKYFTTKTLYVSLLSDLNLKSSSLFFKNSLIGKKKICQFFIKSDPDPTKILENLVWNTAAGLKLMFMIEVVFPLPGPALPDIK